MTSKAEDYVDLEAGVGTAKSPSANETNANEATLASKRKSIHESLGVSERNMQGSSTALIMEDLKPVDGRDAWLVVLGAFISLFISLGSLYGFGIWITSYRAAYPEVGSAQISLIGTIGLGLFFFLGLVAGPLSDKYGPRRVMLAGTFFWTVGFAWAGASTSYAQTVLSHGILVGVGSSLAYWPSITTVPQWFKRYGATGTSIAALGSGLGNLFFALVGEKLIQSMGHHNALYLIAGVGCFLLLVSIILIDRRVPPMKKGGLFDAAKALLHVRNYRIMLIATFIFQFAFFVPFVYVSPYCIDLGFSTADGALALALMGAGSSVGRIVFGPVADKVGKMHTLRWCVIAGGVCICVWPSLLSMDGILAFSFIYGAFGGGFIALSPSACAMLFGASRLGGVFSLINLSMVPGAFASSPLAGLARDATGGYAAAAYPAGVLLMISGFLFMLIRESEAVQEAPQVVKIGDALLGDNTRRTSDPESASSEPKPSQTPGPEDKKEDDVKNVQTV